MTETSTRASFGGAHSVMHRAVAMLIGTAVTRAMIAITTVQ